MQDANREAEASGRDAIGLRGLFSPKAAALVGAGFALAGFALAGGASALGALPQHPGIEPQSPQPGVASAPSQAQVDRGRAAYMSACASCHGAQLQGAGAPQLAGPSFAKRWLSPGSEGLRQAVERMPKQAPGSLAPRAYADITAFILATNGAVPAKAKVAAGSAQSRSKSKPKLGKAPVAALLPSAPRSVARASSSGPSDAELVAASEEDWLSYNRDLPGTRYSPLSQINVETAGQLQPVCILQTGETSGFQSSPIVYKGIGYASTVYSVYAFDATNCERKWAHKYTATDVEALTTNRGIALYEGKIFRGTTDGHLLALDARSGAVLWDARVTDGSSGAYVAAAPVVFKNRVYVGTAGGDYGVPGKIFAFDAVTGGLVWTFNTIPKKGEPGSETWRKGHETGGGASWTSIAIDPAEGVIYVPVGNPAPDFNVEARPGRNLYTNSIVALDAQSGRLRWYVQQSPADYHDFDTSAPPVLYEQGGRRYMAVGTKDGHVYVYDRDTHALLSKTPVTTIKNAELPLSRGRARKLLVCPGPLGGVEWYGPAYSPQANALFVGANDWCAEEWLEPTAFKAGAVYLDGVADFAAERAGRLTALDSATGQPRWSYRAPAPMLGGVTPTAGGVVMTGGADGYFMVFAASDGRILYRFNTGGAIGGGVSTYQIGGRQYVAVAAGTRTFAAYGVEGAPTLVVFGLPMKPQS